jgi:succinate dehydrogenase / fumarate reductase cytochrome b subunit
MYRGGPGMLAWALHRITGVAVLLFLFMHILETTMIGFGPDLYNATFAIYRQLWFKPIEFLLVAAVIYHAGNGIIVMILDFWPAATRVYRTMVWTGAVIYTLIVIPLGAFMMRRLFGF